MWNISDFTNNELLKQISVCESDLFDLENSATSSSADLEYCKSELHVARNEAIRRGLYLEKQLKQPETE